MLVELVLIEFDYGCSFGPGDCLQGMFYSKTDKGLRVIIRRGQELLSKKKVWELPVFEEERSGSWNH